MKRYQLKDILPSKVQIRKNGEQLEIFGNEDFANNHAFTFTVAHDFVLLENKFVKKPSDFEYDVKYVKKYLDENNFEAAADPFCQNIIDKLNERENEFKRAQKIGREIRSIDEDIEIPNFSRKMKLKSYQLKPVQHMIEVPHVANFSIPGSGKTAMTYAAYSKLRSNSGVDQLFVVGPLSSFKPWEEEFTKCFGTGSAESVLRYVGSKTDRKRLFKNIYGYDVILTSVGIVQNDYEMLAELFQNKKIMLVIDESHRIKSFDSNATFSNTMIDIGKFAAKRVILTGTPMPYDWHDLWSQITFLYPDMQVLGTREAYETRISGTDIEQYVSDKVDPLWRRVSLKQMSSDLPERKSIPLHVPMSQIQNEIYRGLEADWLESFEQESGSALREIAELKRVKTLRLLQSITNPGIILKPDNEFGLGHYDTDNFGLLDKLKNYREVPNKIKMAKEKAIELANKGKSVIIWTVFKRNVELLCDQLHEMKPIGISGEIPVEDDDMRQIEGRDAKIERFKNNKGKIMVATLGSIAESVSLHRNSNGDPVCQNAIYLERSFNAGQFIQSLFRIYRIGSDPKFPIKNIFLVGQRSDGATGTIDDEVHDRLEQRTKKMFNMMKDENILQKPLDISVSHYKENGLAQLYDDKDAEKEMIYNKIRKMIKKYQAKHDI